MIIYLIQREAFNIKPDHPLTDVYPTGQHIIIVIYTASQLPYVFQAARILPAFRRESGKMPYLRPHAVYVRQAFSHHLATGLAGNVLPLVTVSVHSVHILLFLHLTQTVLLSGQLIGIPQGHLDERIDSLYHSPSVPVRPAAVPVRINLSVG